jgi:FKBP-type peptidyl-prolyl cis-trans isomerase
MNVANLPRGFFLVVTLLAAGCQAKPPEQTPISALTEDQKAIYAFGVATGQQVAQQTAPLRLSPEELVAFQSGFSDALNGKKPAVEISEFQSRFQSLVEGRLKASADEAAKAGEAAITTASGEKGAVKTASGMVYQVLKPGTGAHPKATDSVRVHYEGKLPDGQVFDSSVQRGSPAEFALNRVIPCWTEGVQLMQVGEKAKLVCPPSLAYGESGAGGKIPPNATLIFEVELLDITSK